MAIKITGLKPIQRRLKNLQTGFGNSLEISMERLFEDIIDQAMENLRNRLTGRTFSRGTPNNMKLTDNLDAWTYEKIGVSAGYHQWKLWNMCDHAAPVETGSRTPILPHGEWLNLGNGVYKREVKGQAPKHFFGDALYYQRGKWEKNLAKYMRSQIRQLAR